MSDTQTPMQEALAKYQSRDFEGAITILKQIVQSNPRDWEAGRMLGFALHANGDHEGAIKAFKDAIDVNNQDSDNYYGLAMAHQALDDHAHAIIAFDRCLKLNPTHPVAKKTSVPSYAQRALDMESSLNLIGAEEYFEKAYHYGGAEEDYNKLLQYYHKTGQGAKAGGIVHDWNQHHPGGN